jgi:hypothetical protein
MLKNLEPTTAKVDAATLMEAVKAYNAKNPDHLRNPFTQGLQFEDGESVVFEGFTLQPWTDTADSRRFGAYVCVVLNGKNYSLSSPLKTKLGTLLDKELNPSKEERNWSATGGLADLLRTLADFSEENLTKVEDFFLEPKKGNSARKPIARKMWVRWIAFPGGGSRGTSITNIH